MFGHSVWLVITRVFNAGSFACYVTSHDASPVINVGYTALQMYNNVQSCIVVLFNNWDFIVHNSSFLSTFVIFFLLWFVYVVSAVRAAFLVFNSIFDTTALGLTYRYNRMLDEMTNAYFFWLMWHQNAFLTNFNKSVCWHLDL